MSDNYKKVESNIFKFEKAGDAIEGRLKSVEKNNTFQKGNVYKIEKSNGEIMTVFSTTVLDSQMICVPVGSMVKIIYTGSKENKKAGQNDIKLYDVFYK